MEIVYILSVLWLLVATMLLKKSNKKQNFFLRMIITIILYTAYNVFLGFILLILNIKYNFITLSLINILISGIMTYFIYFKKEIQKYYIKTTDIVFLLLLLVLIVGIAVKQYKGVDEIKYETTDPAVHFRSAKEFYETQKIEWGGMMPAAFINTEVLFDTFDFMMNPYNFYYLYIVFDLVILYLIGAILYLGITDKTKSLKKSIIAMIFSILFVIGYPLNSMIFGFAYLSLGILYMTTIIAIGRYAINNELNLASTCVEMFLILFGIFFSYYFFVPVIYVSFGLYLLFDMIKNRKNKKIFSIITKENIIKTLSMLILPTIIGFCYFVLPGLIKTGKTIVGHIATEGYIYRNLYSNFVLLAPFTIFYVLYNIKNKKNSLSTIMGIVSAIFTIYLLKKGLKSEVSSYYYYKMYFLLWSIVFYMNIKAMFIFIDNKNELYTYSYTTMFIAILAIAFSGYDYKVSEINILFNPENSILSYANIYMFNKNKIESKSNIYTKAQLDAVKETIKKASNESEIQINGAPLQMLWASSAWELTDNKDLKEHSVDEWIQNENKNYYINLDKNQEIEKETEEYNTIYENEEAIVLEKKRGK